MILISIFREKNPECRGICKIGFILAAQSNKHANYLHIRPCVDLFNSHIFPIHQFIVHLNTETCVPWASYGLPHLTESHTMLHFPSLRVSTALASLLFFPLTPGPYRAFSLTLGPHRPFLPYQPSSPITHCTLIF